MYSSVADPALGTVVLSGLYAEVAGADTLAIIVHGHGGNAGKPYCHSAALDARECGFSSLRISLRGADFAGEDIYHGGLTKRPDGLCFTKGSTPTTASCFAP